MFSLDARSCGDVCRALLARVDAASLWCNSGPTAAAELERQNPPADSTHARRTVLLGLAFDLWEAHTLPSRPLRLDHVAFVDILLLLQPEDVAAVASLLHALVAGPDLVGTWLREQRRQLLVERGKGAAVAVPLLMRSHEPGAAEAAETARTQAQRAESMAADLAK